MDLTLKRTEASTQGIFGELRSSDGSLSLHTLEHSYNNKPKLPPGKYTCVRSMHRLHNMANNFETFEIMGVVGHDNILFHWGNYNKDSEGCVLVGLDRVGAMVTSSRKAFELFMRAQDGEKQFTLTVLT